VRLFTFADVVTEIPARRGMAGVDAINRAPSGGTRLFDAIATVNDSAKYDRIIVITDEQAFGANRHGTIYGRSTIATCPDPTGQHADMINVASAQNGVGYGRWTHIDGFSESVLRFIHEKEGVSEA
jgi:60 kDa SS-A/Ro ribonucleoprotein